MFLLLAPLEVEIVPPTWTVQEGDEKVKFNCVISGEPVRKIIWKKDGQNILANSRLEQIENVLIIKSIKREDKGIYQCFAVNEFEVSQASAVILLTDDPPKFIEYFDEVKIEPFSKLSLKCIASGTPLPQITWTLDGYSINEHLRVRVGDYVTSEGHVNSFVNISSITVQDGGLYSCQASNGVNSVFHKARINVVGSPYVKPMDNVTIVSGQTLTLHCPWSGYPIENIAWFKNGVKLPQNHRQIVYPNGTFVIKKCEVNADQDVYQCVVTNKLKEMANSSVYLKVITALLISPINISPNLSEGMRNMLTCSVLEGDPPFKITWQKNGQSLSDLTLSNNISISSLNEYSSTLFIKKVTFEDSGNYTCIISNSAASTNYTINMMVKGEPSFV